MLAHVVSIPLGLADIGHRGIIVLLLHAIVHAVFVLRHALGCLHAGQQRQGGFRTGLGLHTKDRDSKRWETRGKVPVVAGVCRKPMSKNERDD